MKVRVYAYLGIVLTILVLLAGKGIYSLEARTQAPNTEFRVSERSGFYHMDLAVEVSCTSSGAQIYYTEDGSEPLPDGENGMLYEEPIPLTAGEELEVHTLKFLCVDGEEKSGVSSYTYFMGKNVDSRFTTLVVSITSDEEGLYSYDNGILVGGRLQDEYLQSLEEGQKPDVFGPANYNLRGLAAERKANLQIFSQDGEELLSQDCGMRMGGNYSRSYGQKSLQFRPRKTYDEHGTFHISLFENRHTDGEHTYTNRVNRLLLRNSGDDLNHAFIRDPLIQSLASDYGYPLAYQEIPAAAFLNGQYIGFYWLMEPFEEGTMKEIYGDYNGQFVVVNGAASDDMFLDHKEREALADAERLAAGEVTQEELDAEKQTRREAEENGHVPGFGVEIPEIDLSNRDTLEEQCGEQFRQLLYYYMDEDFNDSEIVDSFCSRVDLDNFLRYHAIGIYVGNKDWPYSNMKVYRYVANDGVYAEDGIFDGRYRYLLFDTDFSLGIKARGQESYEVDEDNLGMVSGNRQSPLFARMMTVKEYRDRYVNITCDLMNTTFGAEYAVNRLNEMDAQRSAELDHFLTETTVLDEGVDRAKVEEELDVVRNFLEKRPDAMRGFMSTDLPISTPYRVTTDVPDKIKLSINTIEDAGDNFEGQYYASCGLHLQAKPAPGANFVCYFINGEAFSDADLHLNAEAIEALLGSGDTLDIEVMAESAGADEPIILNMHPQGKNDRITLYNPSDRSMSLDGFSLTDDLTRPRRTMLDGYSIPANGSLVFYGEKCDKDDATYENKLKFSLQKGETIYLLDENKQICTQLVVPDMAREDSDYELDPFSGKYFER